jgi:hypothetical protein
MDDAKFLIHIYEKFLLSLTTEEQHRLKNLIQKLSLRIEVDKRKDAPKAG